MAPGQVALLEPEIVAAGEAGERLLEKLLGRQVLALAYVVDTNSAMIQFDAETCVYFRVRDNCLSVEIEAPEVH